jgi:hypothetical protein
MGYRLMKSSCINGITVAVQLLEEAEGARYIVIMLVGEMKNGRGLLSPDH